MYTNIFERELWTLVFDTVKFHIYNLQNVFLSYLMYFLIKSKAVLVQSCLQAGKTKLKPLKTIKNK